jgi:putative aldouronate transport system permease protein
MTFHRRSFGDKIFDVANGTFLIALCAIMLYPLYHVAVASVSDGNRLLAHTGGLIAPLGFTLAAYERVFANPLIVRAFMNSIYLVIVGTTVNLVMTSFAAYVLSRKDVMWKGVLMVMIVTTMMFQRGLVPFFLTVRALGLLDTLWSVIFGFALAGYNVIIMRTYFQTIPDSLEESAKMDGANHFTILFRIILPVAKPVVATMILFYGVARWNGYFYVMIFIRDRLKYPISLILREVLIANTADTMSGAADAGRIGNIERISDSIRYATTMVATVPILMLYPFLQRYFVKGVMIGSLKG